MSITTAITTEWTERLGPEAEPSGGAPENSGDSPVHSGRKPCHARGAGGLKRVRRGVSLFFSIVVTVVVVLAAILSVASHFSSKNQYEVFGHPVLSVLSGSMTPAIRTGDLVIDDPVTQSEASSLHAGQIITFKNPSGKDAFFTHRIYAVRSTSKGVSYVTKGDANNAPDAVAVPARDVVGLYSAKVPYGGYVLRGLRTPLTLGLLFGAIVLWLGWEPVLRWVRGAGDSESADDMGRAHRTRRRARHAVTH